jgi:hypothetical protein
MIINAVLTEQECAEIVESFDTSLDRTREMDEYYRGSTALYQPPVSLKHVDRLQKLVEKQYGPLVFQNTYMRSYVKNSILKMHTDRPGLDVTLSICLEHGFVGEYPLYASNKLWGGPWDTTLQDYSPWLDDNTATELAIGDAVAVEGSKYPHWRDPFMFSGRAVYIFYHWAYAEA